MKSNNKAFTLIELLAVIVILAIIALIATPLILNVIDTAKAGAAKASAYNYVKAVEHYLAMEQIDENSTVKLDGPFTDANVSIKGKAPSSVNLTLTNGVVTGGTITIDGYTATFDSTGSITEIKKES